MDRLGYILALFFAQFITAVAIWQLGFSAATLIIALAASAGSLFWIDTTAKLHFAHERERLKLQTERAKLRAQKSAQKEITRAAVAAHAKANIKVGVALTAAAGIGVVFVLAQMMTAGILVLTSSLSAAGGYYLRSRRDNQAGNAPLLPRQKG